MFHVDLTFIFCKRWQVLELLLTCPVCDSPELQHLVACRQNNDNNNNNKNEKYKVSFHLFICLSGVFMVSQQ